VDTLRSYVREAESFNDHAGAAFLGHPNLTSSQR
jgi:hypothetical protein